MVKPLMLHEPQIKTAPSSAQTMPKQIELGSPVRGPNNADLSSWETSMTDPLKYSKGEFRYLVHAVLADAGRCAQNIFVVRRALAGEATDANGRIDLLQTPRRIAEKPTISCSLIDEAHRETWAPGGYILRVPADNILKTCAQDASNLWYGSSDLVAKLYGERDVAGIATPEQLLRASSSHKYNEAVVAGTGRTGKRVEIQGVFLKYLPNGECLDEALAEQLRAIALKNGWPIVWIQEPLIPYKDSAPDFGEDYFGFNRDGKRYIFNVTTQYFYVAEFGGKKCRFMTPGERARGLGVVDHYLTKSPNKILAELVRAAEKVPSDKLLEMIKY